MNAPLTPRPPSTETLARRAVIRNWVTFGKRLGYGMYGLAVAAFVAAAISDFPGWLVTLATVGLVVGSVALPGAIVFGYGILAAEREERGGGSFH